MRKSIHAFLIGLNAAVILCGARAHDCAEANDLAPAAGAADVVRYDGLKAVAVTLRTENDLARVRAIAEQMLDCEPHRQGETRFLVSSERLRELEALGLPLRVVADDVQEMIDAERVRLAEAPPVGAIGGDGPGYYADFRDLATTSAYLDQIIALNPAIASRVSIGTSLQGRDIFGVRISGPGAVGAKPGVWIQAVQHAREWAVLPVAMWTAEQLVSQYGVNPQITSLVNTLEIYIVPIVNPDGYVYTWTTDRLWRKNRRANSDGSFGVDLNRNWSFQWGGTGSSGVPNDETYRGTGPFSEPESTVISQYVAARPNMRTLIDLHSNGQVIIVPWGWSIEPCPDQQEFNSFATGVSNGILSVNGVFHNPGPSGVVLYLSAGNVRDWAYGVEGMTPATIEVRAGTSGFTPPPSSIAPTNAEVYAGILSALTYSATTNPIRFTVPSDPPRAVSTTAGAAVQTQVAVLPGPNATIASVTLFSRFGSSGAFVGAPMSAGPGGVYSGAIPAPIPAVAGCALGVAQYYFQATDASGAVATFPSAGASAPITIPIGVSTTVFSDNFETNQGWTVGAAGDTATAGLWIRAAPVTNNAQPNSDNPLGTGTLCFITANGAAGSVLVNDVDGGPTTLTSPPINGSGSGQLWASYYRWFSNDLGASRNQVGDDLRVFVSGDGVNFSLVETCVENTYRWIPRFIRVADFTAPTASMRLRFVARDTTPDSCVEAGVDDVAFYRVACAAVPGDVNGDGAVNFADLAALLSAFGQTGLPGRLAGDVNGDGSVNFSDLSVVLANFGA